MLMILNEYDEVLDILNKDDTKINISNMGFIFYKYIFLYIIYNKYNDTKKDLLYQKLKNFFFISKFKVYFDNAVLNYNSTNI